MVIPSFKVSDNVNSDIIYVVVKFIESTNSNINEVIRTVLNFVYFFFTKRFCTHKKHQKAPKSTKKNKKHKKHQKHKDATKQKHKNANKRTKTKNALICVFVLAKKKNRSLYNGNAGPTKLVKVLSALHEQKLVY